MHSYTQTHTQDVNIEHAKEADFAHTLAYTFEFNR